MPNILIKNRAEIEQMHFAPMTALISVTDAGWNFAQLITEPDHVLRLYFDDVDNDLLNDESEGEKYFMISDEQATLIADFYARVHNKVDIIICQCEHGQSRSAAIAAAFLEHQSGDGIKIFADDRYYPNKIVFRKVLQALEKEEQL